MKTKITALTSIIFILSLSCAGTAKTVKDVGTTIGNTFIECAKADIGQTVPEFGITVLGVVTQILMAGAGNYLAKLDEIGAKYGNDAEACAVLAITTVLSGGSGSASHTSASPALARAQDVIKSKGWQFKSGN